MTVSCCRALGQKRKHLNGRKFSDLINDPGDKINLYRKASFVSGHIYREDMLKLDRNFIFTILRDPRERYLSLFAFDLSRSRRSKGKYAKGFPFKCFLTYLRSMRANKMTEFFLRKSLKKESISSCAIPETVDLENILKVVGEEFQKFDLVYADLVENILIDLCDRELIPSSKMVSKNHSETNLRIEAGGSEKDCLDELNRLTNIDSSVYNLALDMFPKTARLKLKSDEAVIDRMKKHFGIRFS